MHGAPHCQPCGNYSINGGCVCHAHGGRSPKVRQAANRRLLQAALERKFVIEEARYQERRREWWIHRVGAAAEVLEIDPVYSVRFVGSSYRASSGKRSFRCRADRSVPGGLCSVQSEELEQYRPTWPPPFRFVPTGTVLQRESWPHDHPVGRDGRRGPRRLDRVGRPDHLAALGAEGHVWNCWSGCSNRLSNASERRLDAIERTARGRRPFSLTVVASRKVGDQRGTARCARACSCGADASVLRPDERL